MTWANAIRRLSFGFLFGIFALGFLPLLVIMSWAEIFNVVELEASPMFLLIGKFIGQPSNTTKRKRRHETDKLEP